MCCDGHPKFVLFEECGRFLPLFLLHACARSFSSESLSRLIILFSKVCEEPLVVIHLRVPVRNSPCDFYSLVMRGFRPSPPGPFTFFCGQPPMSPTSTRSPVAALPPRPWCFPFDVDDLVGYPCTRTNPLTAPHSWSLFCTLF